MGGTKSRTKSVDCKNCEMVKVIRKVTDTINQFIDIHNRTSDVVFSNQMIYSECRKSQAILNEFKQALDAVGVKV